MSPEVSRFDNKASMIVSQLFAAYYRKPQILPPSTLRHMAILERAENLNNSIDLSNCNYNIAKQEIGLIQEANVLHLFEKGIDKTSQSYEYAFKKKLLVRLIVDHIAGMTDTYATTEYEKIYHPGIL